MVSRPTAVRAAGADQHGIAEFVRAVAERRHLRRRDLQRLVVHERAHQLVMARAGLVHAGEQDVHHLQARRRRHLLGGDPGTRPDPSGAVSRMLESANHRRADGNHAAAVRPGHGDRFRRCRRNLVRLVEGQHRIERVVAGRRDAGRVRDGGESDAVGAQRRHRTPVERESGGRRLERRGYAGNRRPDVPQRERRVDVGVLNRPAVVREPRPDRIDRAAKADRHEPRVPADAEDRGSERAKGQPVAP